MLVSLVSNNNIIILSWRARTAIYRARNRDGNTRIYMDLIKRRFELKKKAQVTVKNYEDVVDFVFADVNNNICLRLKDGRFKFF